jgi:type VI secretion system secreted protein VgrG
VNHTANQGDFRSNQSDFNYDNSFTAIPLGVPYRPPRDTPKPFVQGVQTAVVVGPPGQEIFTDKFGRVKVQFHWDREGKNNADSSCWVRVAQVWAGKRWGASFWPRIGQEVIVAFQEGDPDQPIIVGSVYNSGQMPPYLGEGPDGKHKNDNKVSGVKSNTTLGGVGYNEWRFDDTKGKEQVFIHAEKDHDLRVKNDRRELILHDTHLIVGAERDGKKVGDQRELVFKDRHQAIHGHHTEHIHGNVQYMVGHGDVDGGNVDVVIEKDKKELIEKNSHLHVKSNQMTAVDGTRSVTVGKDRKEEVKGAVGLKVAKDLQQKVGGSHSLTVAGSQNVIVQKHALDADQTIYLRAGMTLVLEASAQLSLKVGGSFIDISPAGIAITGPMVMINSGGAAGSGEPAVTIEPQPPDAPDAAKQAKPTKPDVADDAVTGLKSAP